MKKKLLIALYLVTMILFSANLYAQAGGSSHVGFQLEGYLPVGDWSDLVSAGIGGSVLYNYKTTDKISITGAIGYYNFLKGDAILFEAGNFYYTYTIVPFLVGIQYAVLSDDKTSQPYIGCELGLLNITPNYETHFEMNERNVILTGNIKTRTRFVFAPAVGFILKLVSDVNLDINAKWNIIKDVNHVGLNLGLLFRI